MSGELAKILAVAGGIDDDVLGGWPAVMIGYPAAVTVALAFATMILVSRLTRASHPDVAQIFARMHVPERLGIGVVTDRPLTASPKGFAVSRPYAVGM